MTKLPPPSGAGSGMPAERIFFLPREDNWWGPAGLDRSMRPELGDLLRHRPARPSRLPARLLVRQVVRDLEQRLYGVQQTAPTAAIRSSASQRRHRHGRRTHRCRCCRATTMSSASIPSPRWSKRSSSCRANPTANHPRPSASSPTTSARRPSPSPTARCLPMWRRATWCAA